MNRKCKVFKKKQTRNRLKWIGEFVGLIYIVWKLMKPESYTTKKNERKAEPTTRTHESDVSTFWTNEKVYLLKKEWTNWQNE